MSRRIVVIDDSPLFRELESRFLAGTGEVETATDGKQGLELVQRNPPDVVVVDLDMPDLSGDEVCQAIKADAQLTGVGVIVITDGEHPEDRARAIRAGADDVLTKPINRISLIQSVRRFGFSPRRQLKRVAVKAPVRIVLDGGQALGVVRNLSRGGIFVEADCPLPLSPSEEVELRFELPESSTRSLTLSTTAKVVWRSDRTTTAGAGLGLQFLELNRANAARIEDFVYERTDTPIDATPSTSDA